ncbi:hypothetical protein E2R51_17385 [Jeotgalibacillus sp. S-D1]|uniref:hypothetical protein n=1 Tax=Jeotgalibacillus sp. S-D1 TaxID=2552189 RepID=UPI00105AA1F2|nr:hypothetical protein [Jeotgalibacillus sp. S-D1]TDL30756.1 hypothetical protein E2R51_17385 [Jeotgalibacillus sp. S-D1]
MKIAHQTFDHIPLFQSYTQFLIQMMELLLALDCSSQKTKIRLEKNIISSLSLMVHLHESLVSKKLLYPELFSQTLMTSNEDQLEAFITPFQEFKRRVDRYTFSSEENQKRFNLFFQKILSCYPPLPYSIRFVIEKKVASPWLATKACGKS